jgi:hypothetical protein
MRLAEGVLEVSDLLRGQSIPQGDGPDHWERIVSIIAKNDSLPYSEVQVIEKAIAEAYCGWSAARRRAIWYETESGMSDDDKDDSLCDTSLNGIGYALEEQRYFSVPLRS